MCDFLKLAVAQLEKNNFVFGDTGVWEYQGCEIFPLRCSLEFLPNECILLSELDPDSNIKPLGLHFVIPCSPDLHYFLEAAISCFIAEFKKQGCS